MVLWTGIIATTVEYSILVMFSIIGNQISVAGTGDIIKAGESIQEPNPFS